MLLGPAHRHAGRPSCEEHTPGDLGEHREDVAELFTRLGVHGRGEAAADRADRRERLVDVGVLHDEGRGAEALGEERRRVGEHRGARRGEHDGRSGTRLLHGVARDDRHAVVRREAGEAFRERGGDAVGEHRHGRGHADRRGDALGEARPGRHEDDTRVRAELAGAEGEGCREAGREFVGPRVEGGPRDEHGVHGAELAVEGDRVGTARGEIEQGTAAVQRSGEADGADLVVQHERDTRLASLDEREHALGGPGLGERVGNHLGRAPRESRMRRVALHDDGASGGESRGGVAARDREGEREVRRAEHGDGAERTQDAPQVGSRRDGRRARMVDRRLEVGALDDRLREEAQLRCGAGELSREARGAEVRLVVGDPDELRPVRIECVRDRGEPRGALGGGRRDRDREGSARGIRDLVEGRHGGGRGGGDGRHVSSVGWADAASARSS